ncbi:hypothetical protein P9139_21165 [Curtobacterium flaccumfaciens]|nr:hypothetical protein P9139_21165 [Curtobacterium flaccumfaciens]
MLHDRAVLAPGLEGEDDEHDPEDHEHDGDDLGDRDERGVRPECGVDRGLRVGEERGRPIARRTDSVPIQAATRASTTSDTATAVERERCTLRRRMRRSTEPLLMMAS